MLSSGSGNDLRTNQHFTLKTNPLKESVLEDFVACYFGRDARPARSEDGSITIGKTADDRAGRPYHAARKETERFKKFTYEDIVESLEASLKEFRVVEEVLGRRQNLGIPRYPNAVGLSRLWIGNELSKFGNFQCTDHQFGRCSNPFELPGNPKRRLVRRFQPTEETFAPPMRSEVVGAQEPMGKFVAIVPDSLDPLFPVLPGKLGFFYTPVKFQVQGIFLEIGGLVRKLRFRLLQKPGDCAAHRVPF